MPLQPQAFHDTLLTNKELCKTLLGNTDNYQRIGPLCTELTDLVKLFKNLHSDGHGVVINPGLLKLAKEREKLGVETVAYTYILFYVRNEFPKISNLFLMSNDFTLIELQTRASEKRKME